MANSNEGPGIPEFMLKTSTHRDSTSRERGYQERNYSIDDSDVFLRMARNNSLDSKPIKSTKSKKKVDQGFKTSLKGEWKKFAVGMGLGAALLLGAQKLNDSFWDSRIVGENPVVQATQKAVYDHTSMTDNNKHWQVDTLGVSLDVDTILENGGDPLIVLGTLANCLDETYAQDELSHIVNRSFGEEPDNLVRRLNPNRYEEGIQDPDFKKDVREYIVLQAKTKQARANIGLESMLDSDQIVQRAEKGMGGK